MLDKSIIRNGNHFIYLDGAGWVLIDGPWFSRLPDNLKLVEVPKYQPTSYIEWANDDVPPTFGAFERIIWEAIHWLSGYRKIADFRLSFRYRTEIVSKYRYKLGWRIHPDGKLPIYFNALEWQPEMERDYTLLD